MVCIAAVAPSALAAPCDTSNPAFVVNGITCQLSGVHTFDSVTLRNGAVIEVNPYDGSGNKVNTGNLELRAPVISIDASSSITAVGSGYQTLRCDNGTGPVAGAGGLGGCMVDDSGGGGAHFGGGGRGTKDCNRTQCGSDPNQCEFPGEFEEACGPGLDATGNACVSTGNCWTCDALPTVAGTAYWHSIYTEEFGASGGDKGCFDGDGFGSQPDTAGPGGGRIVLVGLNAGSGSIDIQGRVVADGRRGCGTGNDSAGGGAGGTVFIVGDQVTIGDAAVVTSAGGLGGDTQVDPSGVCSFAQQGGTCDDCGGGGGGGIVSVLSVTSNISDTAVFNVNGGLGGVCTICRGEAGGGVGELQIAGGYVGELCDGFDNDFDGSVDEGLPPLSCSSGSMPSCAGGLPQQCPPDPSCPGPVTDTRARFLIVVDTSGSMLTDLQGRFTFGDGSAGHEGADTDGNGAADDSRLYRAKQALTTVISAYPEIDFALARYHQDEAVDRSCQLAHWFECHDICCTYDDPRNNTGAAPSPSCAVDAGAAGSLPVLTQSPGDECINYAGSCGPPERGADVLVGFGADINQYLMWLDHRETNFLPDATEGDYCDFAGGGDCELRGTGPTPLAGSLATAKDYLQPIVQCDAAFTGGCRSYGVILLTDGAESCQGDPVAAAAALRTLGIETFVVGFSVLPAEETQLNAIANAGSLSGTRPAFLVGDQDELANALASIVGDSIVFERCNGADDDCDGAVDEDFPDLGDACDDGLVGICRGTGNRVCNATEDGTECDITNPGQAPGTEMCNGLDDDCDVLIDEGLSCVPDCTPTGRDVCDGMDNDCDGAIDEDDPSVGMTCGQSDIPPCQFGTLVCLAGGLECVGEIPPNTEVCNGIDDDCDGVGDETAACPGQTSCVNGGCRIPCSGGEFDCPSGFECVDTADGRFCVPSPCAACAPGESCINDECVNLCADVTCADNEECRQGNCFDCHVLGCPGGQVCYDGQCEPDPCADVDCSGEPGCRGKDASCSCVDGACVPDCDSVLCPEGQVCTAGGTCTDDPCAGVTCTEGRICVER